MAHQRLRDVEASLTYATYTQQRLSLLSLDARGEENFLDRFRQLVLHVFIVRGHDCSIRSFPTTFPNEFVKKDLIDDGPQISSSGDGSW